MTVKELIDELKKQPQGAKVFVYSFDLGGVGDIVKISKEDGIAMLGDEAFSGVWLSLDDRVLI